ncbi:hypothetical protein E3G52_000378 [Mycobacteroides abscessus]|uniref:hypothetical protein n=1 Tax=Mycobacteroides abscessus TaxID=36809 RepID=UPI00187841D8|nr:hypothetical protein [Mycobacteroides abscessus]MBE5453514.1 hypothetical protein [Mycobacteroides abscessus]
MPRSVDLVPQNFKAEYDPTNQLATDPALQKAMKDFGDVIGQLPKMAQAELKRLIDTLVGIATNPIPEIVHWLDQLKSGLSNILSWINPGLLPLIPLGQIGEWYPNLLLNGGFDTDVSVQDNPDWLWDGTIGRTNPLGSVKAIMSGAAKSLKSNEIPVVKGQHLELEVFTSWQGVTAAASTNPIRLVVTAYQAGVQVLSTVVAQLQPATANSSGWSELHGTYTVPDGVDMVRTTLLVTGDVTAGTVWFDDADTWKTGKLPQDYVQDLVGQLNQFAQDISDAFDGLAQKVGLDKFKEFFDGVGGQVNSTITDIENRLQHLLTADGTFDASKLFNLGNIPQIGTGRIDGLDDLLNLKAPLDELEQLRDKIGGAIGATLHDIEVRLAGLNGSGQFDVTKLLGQLGQGQVTGLPDISTWLDQLRKILAGTAVSPGDPITQAIKDWFTLNLNKTASLNNSGQLAGTAITGAIAEAQTGMGVLRDVLVNGMAGLLGGGGSNFTNTQAQNQATQLAVIAQQAAVAAAAIQAQYQRQQNTIPSGLLSYVTLFGGADGAALPAEFSGSDLEVRGSSGYCGIDAARADGTYIATCNKQTTTDDVQTTIVIGDLGGLNAINTYTLFSSDSGYTTGAYLAMNGAGVSVGKYTRSGGTFTPGAPFMSWSGAVGQGIAVTAYRKSNNWVLDVGGDVKATTTNSTVTTGASNRYGGGIVMVRKTASTGWFSGNYQYDSNRLVSLYLGDFYAKSSFYSGARMTRPGGSNINGPTHAYNLPQGSSTTFSGVLPTNFFNLQNFASDDVTVNVASGSITINNPGLYYVHYDLPWTTAASGNSTVSVVSFTSDVVVNTVNHIPLTSQEQQTIPAGNDGSGGGTISLYWDKPEFLRLNAGDVVQLGYTLSVKNTGLGSKTGNANMAYANGSGFFGIYKLG